MLIEPVSLPLQQLPKGETAIGEIAAGPGGYRRIVLDQGRLVWNNDLLVLSGLESQIEVKGLTIAACLKEFWDGICELRASIIKGFDPPVNGHDAKVEYRRVFTKRFMATIASPPNDWDEFELQAEFWTMTCPRWMNPKPIPMGGTLPF